MVLHMLEDSLGSIDALADISGDCRWCGVARGHTEGPVRKRTPRDESQALAHQPAYRTNATCLSIYGQVRKISAVDHHLAYISLPRWPMFHLGFNLERHSSAFLPDMFVSFNVREKVCIFGSLAGTNLNDRARRPLDGIVVPCGIQAIP
jgi:hypothetical protein